MAAASLERRVSLMSESDLVEQLLRTIPSEKDVRCLALVGDRVWCAAKDGVVQVRDARSGDLKGKFLAVPQSPSQQQVYANSIVVLKHHIVTGGTDGGLRIFEGRGEPCLLTVKEHQGPVRCLAACPELESLWSGSDDFSILRFNSTRFSNEQQLLGHSGAVRALLVVDRGPGVADLELRFELWSGASDGIRVWSAKSGKCLAHLLHHEAREETKLAEGASADASAAPPPAAKLAAEPAHSPSLVNLTESELDGAGDVEPVVDPASVFCLVQVGDQVWSGGAGRQIVAWDVRTRACVAKWETRSPFVLTLTRVEEDVWSTSRSRDIEAWSTANLGRRLCTLSLPRGTPTAVLQVPSRVWVSCARGGVHVYRVHHKGQSAARIGSVRAAVQHRTSRSSVSAIARITATNAGSPAGGALRDSSDSEDSRSGLADSSENLPAFSPTAVGTPTASGVIAESDETETAASSSGLLSSRRNIEGELAAEASATPSSSPAKVDATHAAAAAAVSGSSTAAPPQALSPGRGSTRRAASVSQPLASTSAASPLARPGDTSSHSLHSQTLSSPALAPSPGQSTALVQRVSELTEKNRVVTKQLKKRDAEFAELWKQWEQELQYRSKLESTVKDVTDERDRLKQTVEQQLKALRQLREQSDDTLAVRRALEASERRCEALQRELRQKQDRGYDRISVEFKVGEGELTPPRSPGKLGTFPITEELEDDAAARSPERPSPKPQLGANSPSARVGKAQRDSFASPASVGDTEAAPSATPSTPRRQAVLLADGSSQTEGRALDETLDALRSTLSEREAELRRKERQCEALCDAVEAQKSSNERLAAEVASALESTRQATFKLSLAETQRIELERESAALKSRAESQSQRVAELEARVLQLTRALEALEVSRDSVANRATAAESELRAAQRALAEAETQRVEAAATAASLGARQAALDVERETLRRRVESLEQEQRVSDELIEHIASLVTDGWRAVRASLAGSAQAASGDADAAAARFANLADHSALPSARLALVKSAATELLAATGALMSMRLQEQLDGRERESQLQASLQQSAAKAEGVTASADAVERKLRSEIQRLLEELAKSEAACRTLAEERDLVAHAQAEKSLRLAGEKQALEARLLAAEESLCTAKARLEQVDGELSESKKELRETQARLESVSEREGAALALVEAAKQSVEEKEARVSSLRAELAEQKALVARLTSELQELGRVAAANDAALKSVRDELSASASAGAQAREAASSAAARSSRLEEQLALLQQHGSAAVQALEEKLSASVAQVNALERRVAEHDESALASQEKLRQAQGRLDDAQKTAESLRAIGEEQSQSLAVASERLLAAEARCRTLASELHAARTELSQIEDLRRKEAAEAQKQRAQLESELLGARSEAQTARAVSDAQVAENRDILAQRALEIDALRDAAESQRATASQAVRDASELRSRIAEALSRAEAQTTLAQNAGAEVARLEILVKAHEENSKRLATDAATATDALQMRVAQLEQQFRESSAAAARAEAEAVQARADRDAAAAEKTVALDACALARERVSESEQARVELERATSEALAQSIQATQNADRRVAEAEREVQSARARFAHAEKQLLDAAIVERERFEREAADLASRVAELETQLSDAVGAADGAQRREDEAKQKLADKIADQVELQTLLHSAQQMQRDLEQRNASLLAEITALRAQISQGEAASKTVNERRVEYEAETAKAAALSARVRQLEELLATAHARVADLEAAASARSSAQVSAKDARVESAVAMGGAAVLVEHSEVQIRNVPRPRKATAAADRSALSTFSGDDVQAVAQTEGEQWRQRLAALELELARRGADVREARLAVDGLGLELDASREEAHALRVSRAIAEEQRALAVRERDADRAELSRLAEASERLCAQLADAERDQRERVTAIEKEMLGARQRVAELEVEVDRLRNHATELAEKLSAAQDQLLQQRGDAERVAQQLRAEGAQLSILSSERSEESSVLRSRLDQVCEQATSDARRAAAEVADLQRAAKAAEEALAARTFELASAQAVCIELQSEGQLERSRRMGAEEELRSTRLDRIQGPSMLAMEDSVGVERERQRDAANVRSALARELGEHEEVKRHEREKYMQEALAELQQSNSLLREDVRRAQTELESASEAARFVQERCADQEARAADLARQLGDALASAERLERERDDLLDRIRALESAALERSNSPRTPSEREERVGEASVLLSASHEVEGAPNIREGDPAPPLAPPPSVAPAATSSLSEQLREAEASDANEHALESREIELLRALSAAERRGAELEADIAAARTKNEQLEAQLASAASQVLAESWKPHHKRQLSPLVSPRPQSPSDAGPSPRAFLSDTHRPVLQGLFGFQGRSRRAEGVLLDNAMALRARIRARRDALVEGGGKAANGSARGEEEEAEEANRASTDADAEESKKRSKSPVRLGATAQALGSVDSMSSARVQRHPTSPRLQHQHSSSNVSAQGLRLVEASAVRARPLGSAGQQQELHAAAAASLHAAAQPGAALGETGAGAFAAGETDAAAHQAAEQGGAVSTAVCQRAARAERRDGKGKRERGAKRRPRQGEGAPRRNGEEEGGGAAEGDEQQQEGAGERRVSATRRYGVAGAAAAVGTGLALAAFALLGTAPASSPAPALASASLMDAAWEALGASKGL